MTDNRSDAARWWDATNDPRPDSGSLYAYLTLNMLDAAARCEHYKREGDTEMAARMGGKRDAYNDALRVLDICTDRLPVGE